MKYQAIPTQYRGTQFRSSLEARWAAFFDLLGWRWEYEPSTSFGQWIPDFVLLHTKGREPARPVYVEVKPQEQFLEAVKKIERSGCEDPVLVLTERPDGFYANADRYFLGRYLQKSEASRAIVTICSPGGHHVCDPALDRPHHVCDKVDDSGSLLNTHQIVDGFWREASNGVQWRPPLLRGRWGGAKSFRHCWTLSRTREEPEGPTPTLAHSSDGVTAWPLRPLAGALLAVAVLLVIVLLVWRPFDETFEDRDCADFSTWSAAQSFYRQQGGPDSDPHHLDNNRDGIACEGLRAR